jgi:hypothetical protein
MHTVFNDIYLIRADDVIKHAQSVKDNDVLNVPPHNLEYPSRLVSPIAGKKIILWTGFQRQIFHTKFHENPFRVFFFAEL